MRSIVVLLLFQSIIAFAQEEEVSILSDSFGGNEGVVKLSDGSEIKGMLRYDDVNGVLTCVDEQNQKLLTRASVISFEFYVDSLQRKRKFRSIQHEDARTGVLRPHFFEILREYSSFAVLLFVGPLELGHSKGFDVSRGIWFANPTLKQVETFFFMSKNGDLKPFLEIATVEKERKNPKSSARTINEALLKEYFGESEYQMMINYSRGNGLTFKRKDDFLRILAYYESLMRH